MKTRSFLSFPCRVAQETNFKIIQSHREFIPNARREAGKFEVYLQYNEYSPREFTCILDSGCTTLAQSLGRAHMEFHSPGWEARGSL